MRIRLLILITIALVATPACSQNLPHDVYRNAQSSDPSEAATAFVILSNMALSPDFLERLKRDYQETEADPAKFYYEFLLAKRTQQPKYTQAFIGGARDNLTELLENRTRWVSVASPFYELLSMYGRTNDEALSLMIELASSSDGSGLSAVAEDLAQIHQRQPERFENVVESQGVPLNNLRKLMEE